MRWKKMVSALLIGAMVCTMGACGSSGSKDSTQGGSKTSSKGDNKLVVWTLTNDLVDYGKRFQEQTGVKVDTVVIEPADYPTKVQTALLAGETEPDIIVGEPQMLDDFYDAGFFANLDDFGAQDYKDKIVDYVWEVGQDSDGIQRAISYQITPAGFYYRRDIAKEVFGTDDPDEVGKLFSSYSTILDTAKKLKDKGYRIFSSDAELSYFSGDSAWVVDGKLNVDQARYDYMDLCVDLYKNDYTAYATQDAQKTSVFAFGLPSWGVLTMRDHVGDTSGKWGVCAGPTYGFGGGTYIGIASNSKRQDTAWDFVKFCTLNEDTSDWWIDYSQGDTVSYLPALEKHKDDENEIYGGEKLYQFWLEQAKGIDYSKVTRYDKQIGDAWSQAISAIKTGEKSKEDAVNAFYDTVQSTFPEIEIDR